MRRRIAAGLAGGAVLLALGGFIVVHAIASRNSPTLVAETAKPATCADAYRVLKLRPSEVAAATPVCIKQSLKLSGQVVGSVGEAYAVSSDSVAPAAMCAEPRRWDNYPQGLIAFALAGKGYRLQIAAPGVSEHQPLAIYNATRVVALSSISKPTVLWSQATGVVDLNADGISGSINADLRQDIAGASPVHISGQWACGAAPPLPTFDSTVPCANFYALNQLQNSDVARMKAGGCNAQSLVFTEDVAGTIDHAITDSVSPRPGWQGDNYCGQIGGQYTASMKFTLGDETFLLDLESDSFSGVGPGQYDARFGAGPGVDLFLGTADPTRQGLFVPDEHIYWLGRSGSFTIAPDMKSGTVDAELRPVASAAVPGSAVHIKGSWRCAA